MILSTGAVTTFLPKVASTQKPPPDEQRQQDQEEHGQAPGRGDGRRRGAVGVWVYVAVFIVSSLPGTVPHPASAGSRRHRPGR